MEHGSNSVAAVQMEPPKRRAHGAVPTLVAKLHFIYLEESVENSPLGLDFYGFHGITHLWQAWRC
jgi:hypothetical protein